MNQNGMAPPSTQPVGESLAASGAVHMSIYNDGTYECLNQSWHEEDAEFKVEYCVRILERNGLAPRRIVDVGCGTGRHALLISQRLNCVVDGYDISEHAIEEAVRKHKTELTDFHCADFRSIESDYDCGIMFDVFEHVADYMSFLSSARKLAGYWAFHIPIDMNALGVIQEAHLEARQRMGHLHYFSEQSAIATLKDCGFEPVDVIHTPSFQQSFQRKARRTPRNVAAFASRYLLYKMSPRLAAKFLGRVSLMVLAKG